MATGSYNGRILEVNLTSGVVRRSMVARGVLRDFIGGGGVAAKLFFDRVAPDIEPLSEENILFIMTGPMTGTGFPGTARFTVCTKSPLTGIWGESNCGGNFGHELRAAGYDEIAVVGTAQRPVYLWIKDDRVEIRDASQIWGKDTYETTDILKDPATGAREAKVLTIGPAGENLVKYAGIGNDKGDFAARCGVGAVMGSKKLKAIAAVGTGEVEAAMPSEFEEKRKEAFAMVKDSFFTQMLRDNGTDGGMTMFATIGNLPAKNWSLGDNTAVASKIDGVKMTQQYLTRPHACHTCPVGCKRIVEVKDGPYQVKEGPGPEYESCASFGSVLMIDDLAAVIKANELCNRYGLDTISCGGSIALAMDCFENGLITKEDTDGIDLTWGNADAVLAMVHKIASRDGFGSILAEGSKRAAQKIGKNAVDYSVEVKGLEAPMHDPRFRHGMGLAYATSVRGACHLQHLNTTIEANLLICPEIGLHGGYVEKVSDRKAEMTFISENLGMVVNAMILCHFVLPSLQIQELPDVLRMTSGFDYDLKEMMECGERSWLLKRGLCNLMGTKAEDDRLPKRILTPTTEGGAAGSVPDIETMLREYYGVRSLDAEGRPTREKLRSLGLSDLAVKLHG